MNRKENFLRLIKNDNPGWIGDPWEAFAGNSFENIVVADPISDAVVGNPSADNVPYKDMWGVTWLKLAGHNTNPYITNENKALKDIKQWREVVTFPPLDGYDWASYSAFAGAVDKKEYLTMHMLGGGLFERSHYLMGFEDALCNYMLEPETMYELLGAIADWKIGHIGRIIDNLHIDILMFHDDWGSKTALFLPPDIWRSIIKPHQKRIIDFVKSKGVIYMHHSDTFCEPIVEDMVEIGVDIWQGVIPQNDIVKLQKQIGGRMALMGGIDASIIDMADYSEKDIRKEVRRCIDTYVPQGCFVPCIPNIYPVFPKVAEIYIDELKQYGADYFKR
jgi:hypothetical protein